MVAIAKLYRDVLDDQLSADEAWVSMECLANAVPLSNGFFHGHEGVRLV
jgi:hypothetical protein